MAPVKSHRSWGNAMLKGLYDPGGKSVDDERIDQRKHRGRGRGWGWELREPISWVNELNFSITVIRVVDASSKPPSQIYSPRKFTTVVINPPESYQR